MGVYSVSYTLDCLCNHESVKTLLCVFEIVVPFLMGGFDQKDLKNDKCPNLSWRRDNWEIRAMTEDSLAVDWLSIWEDEMFKTCNSQIPNNTKLSIGE